MKGRRWKRSTLFPGLRISSGATGSIIFLHLSHSKFSSAYNLLCRVTLFVSCVAFLTARYKHWNYLGLVSSLSCLCSDETVWRMASSSALQEDGKMQSRSSLWLRLFLYLQHLSNATFIFDFISMLFLSYLFTVNLFLIVFIILFHSIIILY